MKKLKISLLVSLFIMLSCCFVTSQATLPPNTKSLAPMLKKVLPSIVNIVAHGEIFVTNGSPSDRRIQGPQDLQIPRKFDQVGSGVIVDADHGYILTNAHLLRDAQLIMVTLNDDRRMRAKVIGYDAPSDIAVLQIKGKYLTSAKFGDSDKLNVGDLVAAIGNPFGLQQSVTSGVISALERGNLGIEGYENFIQTDAPINPGNSGGALINMEGELIGINTAIISPQQSGGNIGIGFAIPSNMAKSVMEQLIRYGKVMRGFLGLNVQNITPALASAMHLPNTEGALISYVEPGSPAEKAGLRIRDIITSFNGKPIRNALQVHNVVSLLRVGTSVSLQARRQNQTLSFRSRITDVEEMRKVAIAAAKQLLAGLKLKDFNQLVDNREVKGVEVLYVDTNSIGYSSGLRPHDIILSAAEQPVVNIAALEAIAKKNPTRMLLEIKRATGENIFMVLEE